MNYFQRETYKTYHGPYTALTPPGAHAARWVTALELPQLLLVPHLREIKPHPPPAGGNVLSTVFKAGRAKEKFLVPYRPVREF